MTETCILYGAPCSLYTGKARSYLIKQGIGYREISPGAQHFVNDVVPAVHRWRIPVIELSGPEYIQDSTMIIEHFEKQPRIPSLLPDTPKQKIISLLIDVLGAEGLLRPAMHYRWNFKDENNDFLKENFRTLVSDGSTEMAEKAMDSMRQAGKFFGVRPQAVSVIEKIYEEFLELLDKHFSKYPYLLGGRPSIGDFGLIAPFYAHLSRDPYPSSMMKKRAPRVFRWTERMNRADGDMGEFPDCSVSWIENDEIPETLKEVLKFAGKEDLVAETTAAAECINKWLEQNNPAPGEKAERGVGFAEFEIRGVPVQALAQPYRFFLLARMQKAFAGLDEAGRRELQSLMEELELAPLLSVAINREIARHDNLEVWQ
ncbi:MAG: glutathione S-transferase [Desulfobacteraceae bacterium]|nr:glutathione S-transferase [Desulfobacteraceae bacterium]